MEEVVKKIKEHLELKTPEECVHVTSFLSYSDPDPPEDVFIRGKLYHYAIESLLSQFVEVVETEKTHIKTFNNLKLCFTPDMIVKLDGKNTLIEIKSTLEKSLNYAYKQANIYTFLLQPEINIDQCYIIDGALKYKQIQCSPAEGEKILTSLLKSRLF